jgi:hypothetical protein
VGVNRGRALAGAVAALVILASCGSGQDEEPASKAATQATSEAPPATGTITGSLSFPSDYLPEDLQVCARDVASGEQYCDAEKSGTAYRLELAAGRYTVWSQTGDAPGTQAFYSRFITCGQSVDCADHSPVTVEVGAGQTVEGIDPGDWYAN